MLTYRNICIIFD